MSTAPCLMYRADDVWLLASATVYDVREVSDEFNDSAVHIWKELFRALGFIKSAYFELLPGLRRICLKQSKLIAKFEIADTASWDLEACREMSDLLHDLVLDERNFIQNAAEYMKAFPPIVKRFRELENQIQRLDEISLYLDALSVSQTKQPGHDECMQFLADSVEQDQYDFSTEPDFPRVAAIV